MFHVVVHRSGPVWDPARRLEDQSGCAAHASFMDGLVEEGFIVLGGPLSDEHRVVLDSSRTSRRWWTCSSKADRPIRAPSQ